MRRIAMVLAALLVLGTGAVALAAIPSADGTIHGCRDNRTGAVRVIDAEAGQQCSSRETALTWNQTGPAGPPGLAGVHVLDVAIRNADGNAYPNVGTLQCPTGEVALSASFATIDSNGSPVVYSQPVNSAKPMLNHRGQAIGYTYSGYDQQNGLNVLHFYVTCAVTA